MKQDTSTAKLDAHGHVLFMYETRSERLRTLTDYFREGLDKGELCIFVTPDPVKEVAEDFLSMGLDVSDAIGKGSLRVFEMLETYLPHGKFITDYMLLNVSNFIMEAKAKGFTGVRTAGEMAWLYDHPESFDDATQYEIQVNNLNASSPEFTGLCLYPVQSGSKTIVDSALRTHPNFIYDGTMRTNPLTA